MWMTKKKQQIAAKGRPKRVAKTAKPKATGKARPEAAHRRIAAARADAGAGKSRPGGLCCPVARQCGACQSVNRPYGEQLAEKDRAVAELFAGVASADALRPILGMRDPYHYRNKVTSPYAPARTGSASGKGALQARSIACGMYAAGSHRIVDTRECLVENETAKAIVQVVRQLMPKFHMAPYNEDTGEGFLRHAVIRVGHESGEVLVTLVTNDDAFPGSRSFCRELVRRCPAVTTVVQNVNTRQTNVILGDRERVLYGPGFILDTLCGLSFRISSQSFYQVNAVQTEVLYRTAVDLAAFAGNECAIDAYCGTGTIGLVAAKAGAARVVGVDTVASAIRDARENARHNGVDNAEFVVGDAGAFMEGLAAQRADQAFGAVDGTGEQRAAEPLVLLVDPPRAGASEEFLRAAASLAPERIVYISCNPQTQVRDIDRLRKAGYKVQVVQPVDMFPHTPHVETVALLVRGGSAVHGEIAEGGERHGA